MQNPTNTGALIAALAAGLFTSGVATTSQAADTDKVQCHGINSCKGKSACNTADHSCAGMNSCKGKGWIETTASECKAKGGKAEPAKPASATEAQEVRLPVTTADHLALAKTYQDKAATYRKEASYHREMAAAYKKSVAGPSKDGRPNPWAAKMDKHCTMLAKDAEKLAVDAEKAAEYHTLRGKELEGK